MKSNLQKFSEGALIAGVGVTAYFLDLDKHISLDSLIPPVSSMTSPEGIISESYRHFAIAAKHLMNYSCETASAVVTGIGACKMYFNSNLVKDIDHIDLHRTV